MNPRIKVNIGRGYPPVEVQQVIDTDLKTKNKTVVGSINELLEKLGSSSEVLIEGVSNEFVISEDGKILSIKSISQDKIEGLSESLNNKVDKEEGKGLSSNDFTDDLLAKLVNMNPSGGGDTNVIEVVKMNNVALPISNKSINIPISSDESLGVVKSSSKDNMVSVNDTGEMEVNSINVNKLIQTEGETLILECGNAT